MDKIEFFTGLGFILLILGLIVSSIGVSIFNINICKIGTLIIIIGLFMYICISISQKI